MDVRSRKTAGNEFSKIIDNFLPEDEFNKIYHFFMGNEISWSYNNVVDYDDEDDDGFHFTHGFFHYLCGKVSPFSDTIEPFMHLLDAEVLIKVKANLTFRSTENNREGKFHYDHQFVGSKLPDGTLTSYTAIYYINTNNGYTLFKDGNYKVDSVANRVVIFDSSRLHKVVRSTDEKRRIVINFNYLTTKYSSIDHLKNTKKLFNEANA